MLRDLVFVKREDLANSTAVGQTQGDTGILPSFRPPEGETLRAACLTMDEIRLQGCGALDDFECSCGAEKKGLSPTSGSLLPFYRSRAGLRISPGSVTKSFECRNPGSIRSQSPDHDTLHALLSKSTDLGPCFGWALLGWATTEWAVRRSVAGMQELRARWVVPSSVAPEGLVQA